MKRKTPSYPRNVIGKQIRGLRRAEKLSQEELCNRIAKHGCTVTRTQMVKIESGRRPVFDYEVEAIAKALNVFLPPKLFRCNNRRMRKSSSSPLSEVAELI